jgi:putative spermidine/putrescine transport system ATP-binding protein
VRLSRAPSQTADAGVNGVSGRVAAVEYQGTWLKIAIEDACGEGFVANVPDDEFFADPLTIGDPVLARWDPEQLHFLAARSGKASVAPTAGLAGAPTVVAAG